MTDMSTVCTALANQIGVQTGLRAYGFAPGQVVPPCAVVVPGNPAITYGRTLDGEVDLVLRAIVLVSGADDTTGQKTISPFVASSGISSILAAVNADNTAGGAVEFAEVINVAQYGYLEYAGQFYFGATFTIQCGAHL